MKNLKSLLFAAVIPLVAACAAEDQPAGGDDVSEEDDVRVGTIAVQFPWGFQREAYEIQDGFVVIRGDIIVKREDQLRDRAAARVGGRWPNGVVRYAFDAGYPAADMARARAAVAELEAETPISFIEITNPCSFPDDNCGTDYILMRSWENAGGQSANPQGNGQVGYRGGQQIINAQVGFSKRGFQHEFLHALGLYHEQERSDRDNFVQFRPECTIDGKEGNFGKNSDAAQLFGPYDFASIMQYSSSGWAIPDRTLSNCSNRWPLERIAGSCPLNVCTDEDGNGTREFIAGFQPLSANDVDVVWAMYGSALGKHEAGDSFGQSIAHGDFDGDGRRDLAIGAPFENTVGDTVANAGAVMLFKGTVEGFQPWKTITQSSVNALEEADDRFGTALAVGDFDGDGRDDLAIGGPGEAVEPNPAGHAGAIYIMRGTASGLVFARNISQANLNSLVEGGDRFGQALASGDFDGDGKDDLAVGSTGEQHDDGISAGHVFVLRGTGNGNMLAAWDSISQATLATAPNAPKGGVIPAPAPLGTHQANDQFGSALAVGRIDEDNRDDLVVAASCDSELAQCAGGVYLFRGSETGMHGWMRMNQSTGADALDRFGWAVATGDIDKDGDDDVIVGAPRDDVAGVKEVGRVYIARPAGHVIQTVSTMTQANSDFGTNDHFGSSLAFANNGAVDILAVGARNEAWGDGAQEAGAVFIFNAGNGNPTFDSILRAAPASDEVMEDAFGATVAVFSEGGTDFVLAGNPFEDASAGVVQVFGSTTAGGTLTQRQLLSQTTKGSRAP
ncbi:MAG TPA: M12 family metallopeptidase [Kofleriaceae bacterium]|nr:M12 family metallopeptidase [Kofleriaceae bacterium]